MTRDQLFAVFFFLVLAFLLYQVYQVFSGFLAAAAWAGILALVFYPVYRALLGWLGRPALASAATTFLLCAMVIMPAITAGTVVIGQAQNLYHVIEEKVASGEARAWFEGVRQTRPVQLAERLLPPPLRDRSDLADVGLKGAQAATQYLVAQIGDIARNLFSFIVNFVLMVLMLFFFFRDGERLFRSLRELIPMEAEHQDAIFLRFYETLAAVVQGMTVTAFAQGVLAGIAFWALDLPFAMLLALASALASFIPLAGAALVWVPAVGYFLYQGLWVRAIVMLLWGSLVISLADNIVKPLVIGSRLGFSTLFLFLGILGGLQTYGVLGVFLGPALLATIVAVFRIYREEYHTEAGEPVASESPGGAPAGDSEPPGSQAETAGEATASPDVR